MGARDRGFSIGKRAHGRVGPAPPEQGQISSWGLKALLVARIFPKQQVAKLYLPTIGDPNGTGVLA
jgi:hypothetical protein